MLKELEVLIEDEAVVKAVAWITVGKSLMQMIASRQETMFGCAIYTRD